MSHSLSALVQADTFLGKTFQATSDGVLAIIGQSVCLGAYAAGSPS